MRQLMYIGALLLSAGIFMSCESEHDVNISCGTIGYLSPYCEKPYLYVCKKEEGNEDDEGYLMIYRCDNGCDTAHQRELCLSQYPEEQILE